MNELGKRLKSERIRLGLSQSDFASAGGVRSNALGQYEAGKRVPRADFLFRVASFGVDVHYVLLNSRICPASDLLTEDESRLLSHFRLVGTEVRTSVLCILANSKTL